MKKADKENILARVKSCQIALSTQYTTARPLAAAIAKIVGIKIATAEYLIYLNKRIDVQELVTEGTVTKEVVQSLCPHVKRSLVDSCKLQVRKSFLEFRNITVMSLVNDYNMDAKVAEEIFSLAFSNKWRNDNNGTFCNI